MSRKINGRLAEAKVLCHFVEQGYDVYTPYTENSKIDLVVAREGKLFRVSIKYTSVQKPTGKWRVGLRNMSRRNDGKMAVDFFDKDAYDYLAVYIGPLDKVVVVEATFDNRSEIAIDGG